MRTSSNIRVDFDTVMDASSITTTTVLLDGKPLSEIPGAAVVHPTGTSSVVLLKLAPNNPYRLTLTTGIRDSSGQALAEPYTWTFVTASRLDLPDVPVRLLARYPRLNDFRIPTNAPVTVAFSAEMDPKSFGPDSVAVCAVPGGKPVPGRTSVQGKRVLFRPDTLLAKNQPYRIVISDKVKSLRGLTPGKQETWYFTTGDGPAEGFVITDAWFELYTSAEARRFVFHAAVEWLEQTGDKGSASKPAPTGQPKTPAFVVKSAVVSLAGIYPQAAVNPTGAPAGDASEMPVSNGSPPVTIYAAYPAGGSGEASPEEKVRALALEALAQDSAVVLMDTGDLTICGDAARDDGVYSGRMSLPAGFPGGQACVAYTVVADGKEPTEPLTISVHLDVPAQDAGQSALSKEVIP